MIFRVDDALAEDEHLPWLFWDVSNICSFTLNSENLLAWRRIGAQIWNVVYIFRVQIVVAVLCLVRIGNMRMISRVPLHTWRGHRYCHLVNLWIVAMLLTCISLPQPHCVWTDVQGVRNLILKLGLHRRDNSRVDALLSSIFSVVAELQLLMLDAQVIHGVGQRNLFTRCLVLREAICVWIWIREDSGHVGELRVTIVYERLATFAFVEHPLVRLGILLVFALTEVLSIWIDDQNPFWLLVQ